MKKLWFRRKWYGWGWFPVTWEGWTVIAVYLAAVYGLVFYFSPRISEDDVLLYIVAPTLVLTVLLLWICYKTGESPKWQWGPPKE